jgi:hypothetical protein
MLLSVFLNSTSIVSVKSGMHIGEERLFVFDNTTLFKSSAISVDLYMSLISSGNKAIRMLSSVSMLNSLKDKIVGSNDGFITPPQLHTLHIRLLHSSISLHTLLHSLTEALLTWSVLLRTDAVSGGPHCLNLLLPALLIIFLTATLRSPIPRSLPFFTHKRHSTSD